MSNRKPAAVRELDPRSMFLPSGCKPSVACGKDPKRPTLMHGHLLTHGDDRWLCATDTYVCVALKVTVGSEVQDGVVPLRVLQLMEQRKRVEQVSAHAWKHTRQDGCEVVYDLSNVAAGLKPPAFLDLVGGILFDWPTTSSEVGEFGINPEFVANVGRALGGAIRLRTTGRSKPIAVASLNHQTERRALLMPIRITDYTAAKAA